MTSPINSSTDQYSEDFYAFHPWQMQACFFAGSCQACDKLNGMINEVQIHEVAQLAKIHIENRSVADRLVVTIIDQRSVYWIGWTKFAKSKTRSQGFQKDEKLCILFT